MNIIRKILLMAVLAVVQGLILGHIHLFNCATPLVYLYFVVLFQRDFPRWLSILLSFVLGLAVDSFSNTPGMAAASMTLVAFMQPYLLELYLDREDADNFQPSFKSMGAIKFASYVLIMTLIYCVVFFLLESFSFFNWLQLLLNIGGSMLLTVILIIVLDIARGRE